MTLVLGGCSAMLPPQDQMFQQNRFAELRQLMEAKVGPNPAAKTGDLVYLCFAYAKIRAYDRLSPCIDRLQARIDGGDTKLYWFDFSAAPSLLRAQAAIELGDFPKAIEQSEIAYRLTQPKGVYLQMKIYALSVRSLAFALVGQRTEAERFATELAAVDTSYPDTLMASDKYIGLARTRMALGDHRGALDALERDDSETGFLKAMTVVTTVGMVGESIFSYWELPKRFIRARAQLEVGQLDAARVAFDALLKEAAIEQNADLLWLILDDRGRLAERQGDAAAAAGYWRRAVDLIEAQRATIRAEAGRIGFVGDKQGLYHRLVSSLIAQGDDAGAFAYAERAKARALVDLLGTRDLRRVARAAPVEGLMGQLQQAQQALATIDPASPPGLRGARVAELTAQLRRAAPELASLVSAQASSAEEIQALLPDGEALVEYFGGGDDLVAFVVTRRGIVARRLDGRGLVDDIQSLRTRLQGPDKGDPLPVAQRLHARLLTPLDGLLQGQRLLVVPHGPLHYLPFAALHDGRSFMVERHALRMLPAAGVLAYLSGRRANGDRLLLVGNPDLGQEKYDLPHAQVEAEAIHKLWPKSMLLVRRQAGKETVKRLAATHSRLHFASHGVFRPHQPLASGLLLSPEGDTDGMLTVAEIYELSLDADLVTLSACETGLGAIKNGDDVVGLNRGFLFAGARTIVSSLWSVEDEATKELMVGFYAGLAKRPKREALRQAQLAVKARFPHPFYWAAFQLTGDGE
ncbi:MAG: CHAT domain-containing protein [Magnetospirillum sp.]|nr:MAG: CHAT domain-containing protein [Magnetospirillum sp.]